VLLVSNVPSIAMAIRADVLQGDGLAAQDARNCELRVPPPDLPVPGHERNVKVLSVW
jgi:hypothetical protein